jgi:hypothetical protein
VLSGSRGTGKTILLDVIGEVASKELGWAVLHVQALQEESLVAVLLQHLPCWTSSTLLLGRGESPLDTPLFWGIKKRWRCCSCRWWDHSRAGFVANVAKCG